MPWYASSAQFLMRDAAKVGRILLCIKGQEFFSVFCKQKFAVGGKQQSCSLVWSVNTWKDLDRIHLTTFELCWVFYVKITSICYETWRMFYRQTNSMCFLIYWKFSFNLMIKRKIKSTSMQLHFYSEANKLKSYFYTKNDFA